MKLFIVSCFVALMCQLANTQQDVQTLHVRAAGAPHLCASPHSSNRQLGSGVWLNVNAQTTLCAFSVDVPALRSEKLADPCRIRIEGKSAAVQMPCGS